MEYGASINTNRSRRSQIFRRSRRIAENNKFQISYAASDSNDDEKENFKATSTSAVKHHIISINHTIDDNN